MAKPKRKWPRIVAMVLVAILLTGTLSLVLVEKIAPDQTMIPQEIVQLPSTLIAAVIKPLQVGFSKVTQGVTGYLESLKLRKTIEIEYNKLKAQNDELVFSSLYAEQLELENERLRGLLGVYNENIEQNPIMATVTTRETGNWFRMFTIDKGEVHGIKKNMAVINELGLIGYVYNVYQTSSEVISIIDSRAAISGIIQSSRYQGVVRGTLGVDDEPTCRMYYLPVDLVPRPGDSVVTSGIGLPFPKGIRIGEVRESTRYMDENKHYVVIEPYVDFEHIEEVLVLIYEAATEAMPDADDGQIKYVPVPLDTIRPVPSLGAEIDDPNLGAITAPPRATRRPIMSFMNSDGEDGEDNGYNGEYDEYDEEYYQDDLFTLAPGATPTPNPELDALMREELEEMEALEGAGY